MTVISITRARIIRAIKEEPMLQAGSWAFSLEYGIPVADKKNCSVCAVGAVMRDCISKGQNWLEISNAASRSTNPVNSRTNDPQDDSPVGLAKDGWYMQALSDFFEAKWTDVAKKENTYYRDLNKRQIRKIRNATIRFVEKNFPYKIQVDINGAEPAKDVMVVKS